MRVVIAKAMLLERIIKKEISSKGLPIRLGIIGISFKPQFRQRGREEDRENFSLNR
jgi:hypothetical protein